MTIPDTGTDTVCPGSFFTGGTYPVTKGERGIGNTAKSNGPCIIHTGGAGSRGGGQCSDDIFDLSDWGLDDRFGIDIPATDWILLHRGAADISHIGEPDRMEEDSAEAAPCLYGQWAGVFCDPGDHHLDFLRWGIPGDGSHADHRSDRWGGFNFGD